MSVANFSPSLECPNPLAKTERTYCYVFVSVLVLCVRTGIRISIGKHIGICISISMSTKISIMIIAIELLVQLARDDVQGCLQAFPLEFRGFVGRRVLGFGLVCV